MRKMFLIHYPHLVCACLYWHIVSKDMVIPGVLFYVTDGSTCSTFFVLISFTFIISISH